MTAAVSTSATATTAAAKSKRTLTGVITSDKMDKTVTVLVERRVMHPVLGKVVRRSKKYHAHSPNNEFKQGDTVTIEETRPLSKTKAWQVTKLVEKARVE
jgi:small subunit ribosomal protein S17